MKASGSGLRVGKQRGDSKAARRKAGLRDAVASVIERLEARQLLSGTVTLSPPVLTDAGPAQGGSSVNPGISSFSIVPTYESSVTGDPRAAQLESAINQAITNVESFISTPITVNIDVVGAAGTGILGESSVFLNSYSYANIATGLQTNFANTSVPATDPIGTAHTWFADPAEARALGLPGAPTPTFDGTFTFGLGFNYTYDQTAAPGDFDLVGTAEHEITEIMGRIPGLGQSVGGGPAYFPYDLYRFRSAGTNGISNSSSGNYFSIDGGTTDLHGYNNANTNGGDPDDWDSSDDDSFNAFSSPDVVNAISTEDQTVMHAIGYVGTAPSADLAITKTGPATIVAGTDVSYTVTITNNGPSNATNVVVDDPAPAGTSFVNVFLLAGTDTAFASNAVDISLATLPSGNSDSYLVIDHAAANDTPGSTITNTATISADQTDPNTTDNTAATTASITASADLSITKTGPATGFEGVDNFYTIDIANNGASDAQNVLVEDLLPANAQFEGESQNGGPAFIPTDPAIGSTGGTVTYSIVTLAAGDTAEFIIDVTPEEGFNVNNASISSDTTDPDSSNNTASATTVVADASLTGNSAKLPIFTEGASSGSVTVATFTDAYGNRFGDPEGAADFTATITWGDGTTTAGTITQDGSNANLYSVTGTHTYAEESLNDPVSVFIADDGGSTATVSEQALVIDAKLTATSTSLVGIEGENTAGSVQTLTETGTTGGSFKLLFGGVSTTTLPFNASAAQVQTALDGLSTIGGVGKSVTVSKNAVGASNVYEVVFNGSGGVAEAPIIPLDSTLTGPGHAIHGASFLGIVASFTDADPGGMVGDYVANIDWGDGSAGSVGIIVANANGGFDVLSNHVYGEEGVYVPVVAIQDAGAGTSATDTVTVSDPAVVAAPVTPSAFSSVEGASTGPLVLATFTDPGGAEPNQFDPDPNLYDHYQLTINWGDGNFNNIISAGDPAGAITYNAATQTFTVTGTHTYAEESGPEHPNSQPYQITVTVDHENAPPSNVITDTVTVSDPGVIGNAGTTFTGVEGQSTGSIKVAVFSDPGGAEAVGDYSATVDWGDGSTPDNNGVITFLSGNFFQVNDSHTWLEESTGSQPLFVKVTVHHELAPASVTTTDLAFISDPAVVGIGVSPISAVEGAATGVIPVATFTDPGGVEVLGDYSAMINWGDGTPAATGSITVAGGTFTVSGNHTYLEESGPDAANSTPYKVVVTLGHEAAPTTTVTDTATVSDPAVVGTGVAPISAVEGLATGMITLATFSDPGGPESLSDYSATINWGDGTALGAGTISVSGTTFTVKGSHTYAEESGPDVANSTPYQIVVTLSHEAAPATLVSDTATVSDPAVIGTGVAPISGVEGSATGVITLATFSDPGGAEVVGDYSATINWGDGTSPGTGTISFNAGVFTVSGNHTYAEESGPDVANSTPYQIIVTLNHEAAPATLVTDTATITDSPVIGVGVSPISVDEATDTGVIPLATFTDLGGAEAVGDYSATIDWGDGSGPDTTGSISFSAGVFTLSGSHTYAEESAPDHANSQPYEITVTLNHENSTPDVVLDSATVTDPAVIATGVNPINAKKGVSTGSITLATFVDPGGETTTGGFSATIDWGDGSNPSNGTIVFSGGVLSVKGTHTYNSVGTFFPTIVVHHEQADDSNIVTDTVNVTAPVSTLTSTGTTNSGIEGRSSTVKVANFVTTNNSAVIGNFTASINWGDGKVTTGTIVKDSNGHFHVNASHAYAEEAAAMGFANGFPVTVTIKDNASHTTVANSIYKIADAPLDSGAGVSISKTHNVAFASTTTLGTFRDQDALNKTPSDYTGTINWGDGTTSTATFVLTGSTANVGSFWKITGGHTYKTAKTYTVKITVTDKGGASPITITTTIKVV